MSKRAFNKIMQGVEEARAYLEGTADKSRYRVHVPQTVNVKKIDAGSACRRRLLPKPTALRCRRCVTGSKAAAGPNAARAFSSGMWNGAGGRDASAGELRGA